MLQTLTTILSVSWTVMRNTPAVLRHLPMLFRLIARIKNSLGSEQVQEALQVLINAVKTMFPDAIQQDGTRKTTGNTDTPRRRFLRFRNRMDVACDLTDKDAEDYCNQHHISHFETA